MELLSNYQLQVCRETLNRSLPDKAQIERRTKTADGKGGFSSTWNVIAENIRCRVGSPEQETELESGGSTRAQSEYEMTLPWNTDCQPQDRILVKGVRYEMIEPPPAISYAIDLRFKVKRL
jgi:head-tail adaptor